MRLPGQHDEHGYVSGAPYAVTLARWNEDLERDQELEHAERHWPLAQIVDERSAR